VPPSGSSKEKTAGCKALATSQFASGAMDRVDALFPPVHINMFVPCVELLTILRSPALRHELFPIVMMLCWDEWWDYLKMAGSLSYFYDVPYGICSGFNIGVQEALCSMFTLPNTLLAKENYALITAVCLLLVSWADFLIN
jgi:hypothetical protein